MNLPEYARTMAAYNRWMNGKLYEASAELDDGQRNRDVKAFFKSIHGTLNHLLLTDRIWFGRFIGVPFAATSLDQELYTDFEELRRERERTDHDIVAWAGGLSQPDFESELRFTSVTSSQSRKLPLWLAVTHFFNHQTHYRGQVTALLMQNCVDPGVTDLPYAPR